MPSSCVYQGKVLDWKFKKQPDRLLFLVGETRVGLIYKCRSGYTVVSLMEERTHHVYPAEGFKTRWKACEFLLKDSRFWRRDSQDE